MRIVAIPLLVMPLAALAEVDVQNAQYRADKDAIYVKGKIDGDGVAQVYVSNAKTGAQLGTIRTRAGGTQFGEELPVSASQVPCAIKVSTSSSRGFFGRFSGSGDFTIANVQQAPESCN